MKMLLTQITPEAASAWADVPLAALLIAALVIGATAFVREWIVAGTRYKAKEEECEILLQENKQLWREKVDDAGESAKIARAYIELRERELKERTTDG